MTYFHKPLINLRGDKFGVVGIPISDKKNDDYGIEFEGIFYRDYEVKEIIDNWMRLKKSVYNINQQNTLYYKLINKKKKITDSDIFYSLNDTTITDKSLNNQDSWISKIKSGSEITIGSEGESFIMGFEEPSAYDLFPTELALKFSELSDDKKVLINLLFCNSAVDFYAQCNEQYQANFARDFSYCLFLLGKLSVTVKGYTGLINVDPNGRIKSCTGQTDKDEQNIKKTRQINSSLEDAMAIYSNGVIVEHPKKILSNYSGDVTSVSNSWKIKYLEEYSKQLNNFILKHSKVSSEKTNNIKFG